MSEVADVTALVNLASHQPVALTGSGNREFIAVPQGGGRYTLEQVTLPNAANVLMPKTVVQAVRMQTAESMIDYVKRFKNATSMLFADINNDTVVSILDYHSESAVDDGGIKPALTTHKATLKLPKSLEWDTWNAASGVLKSHTSFATFLEENAVDIVSPPGADLLELCRDLQVIQNVKFGSTVRMGDVTELNYSKEADATSKGTVAVPQSIMLSIPVYFGEAPVSIMAFMRRQIEDGKLKLGIQLSRAENVRQDEFHRVVDDLLKNTKLATVYGTPA